MFNESYTYRTFLAVIPPKEILDNIRDNNRLFKKRARNFRFTPIDQLHITLQFLGNAVTYENLNIIGNLINTIVQRDFNYTLSIGNLRFGFPGQNIASLLYYEVEVDKDFKTLTKSIHDAIQLLDLPDIKKKKDHAKLINHITIARTKGNLSRSFTREVNNEIGKMHIEPMQFKVTKIHLISSELKDKGPQYNILRAFE